MVEPPHATDPLSTGAGHGPPPPPLSARPSVLLFPRNLQQELIAHAREGDPDEVCGILGGREDRVERVIRVRNAADEVDEARGVFRDRDSGVVTGGKKPVHYYMDPRDQLAAYNALDADGLDVVGYYHSHTFTEPRPSPTDIRLATDLEAHWVLVSLRDKQHPEVRVWRIVKDSPTAETGEVQPVEVREG